MCGILRVMRCRRLNPFFMWQEALDTFLQDFSPTDTIIDSTEQYSTPELLTMLETGTGETIDPILLVEALNKKGYKLKHTGNLHLEWLFKPYEDKQ